MRYLFVELVSFGGYRQMGRGKSKDKKKRKVAERKPCSEETKAKIKASLKTTHEAKVEAKRVKGLDIREILGEYVFGRHGENI